MKDKERLEIDDALLDLDTLFTKWGLNSDDYVLVDEFAYMLQGYDVIGTEVKTGHLDVYVNPASIPWKDKGERSIVPPKDSKYMKSWIGFMQNTGYALDMLRAGNEIFKVPTVEYKLSKNRKIKLMRTYEMTEAFVEQTLMYYKLEDVGEEKITEWLDKIKLIEKVAARKRDTRLEKLCRVKFKEATKRWRQVKVDAEKGVVKKIE